MAMEQTKKTDARCADAVDDADRVQRVAGEVLSAAVLGVMPCLARASSMTLIGHGVGEQQTQTNNTASTLIN